MFRTKLLPLAAYLLIFFHADAVAPDSTLKEKRSFVIIGAFSFQNNALRFVDHVHELEISAKYAKNVEKELFYVYSYITKNDSEAKDMVWKYREKEEFSDAWVFRGYLDETNAIPLLIPINDVSAVQDIEQDLTHNNIANKIPSYELVQTNISPITPVEEKNLSEKKSDIDSEAYSINKGVTELEAENSAKKFDFMVYINAIHARKFREVKGVVSVYDHERFKKIEDINTHQLEGINDPNNGKHTVRFVSNIFGYRPKQLIFDITNPINDSTANYVEMQGDSIILNLNLERLQPGDVAVMWNVLYYKDAAIMRAESKPQLNDLLAMLKENNNMSIAIHGHTNGNSHGKIIQLNHDDKNFFNINGNHHESQGSAKKLSEYRAYTIQHYLMDNGIAKERMKIKGWGGKKMMFDKHDSQAKKNVRVEIEIIQN